MIELLSAVILIVTYVVCYKAVSLRKQLVKLYNFVHTFLILFYESVLLICSIVTGAVHETWNSMENIEWMRRMQETCSKKSKVSILILSLL